MEGKDTVDKSIMFFSGHINFGGEKEISPANYPPRTENVSHEVLSYDKWGTNGV